MTDITAQPMPTKPPRSQWRNVWDQFRHHRGAMITFLLIVAGVVIGPFIYWNDPKFVPTGRDFLTLRDMRPIYVALWDPSAKVDWAYPLGTDNLGRDTLGRLLLGGRVSIAVGLTAMILALFLGTLIGLVAGYFKRLDGPLMRLTDLFLALPILPMIIVRGDVLALKEREFVLAARSLGTRNRKLISRHILPNVLSPIMVSATLGIATAIITESALSFLGFGFPPDFPTWGKLLNDAVDRMVLYPERVVWPGLAISITVLAVNYLGDGLRDALDPRIRGR